MPKRTAEPLFADPAAYVWTSTPGPADPPGRLLAWTCDRCGALVVDPDRHTAFHTAVAE